MDRLTGGNEFTGAEIKTINTALQNRDRLFRHQGGNFESPVELRHLLQIFIRAKNAIQIRDYAQDPDNFPDKKFELIADIRYSDAEFPPESALKNVLSEGRFVYAIQHTPNKKIFSVVSFNLDIANRLVVIDQIQGSDTKKRKNPLLLYNKVRAFFRGRTPERALYDAVRQFALACDFRAIGIRKETESLSTRVLQSVHARRGKERTLYSKIAGYAQRATAPHKQIEIPAGLKQGDFANYDWEMLQTRENVTH